MNLIQQSLNTGFDIKDTERLLIIFLKCDTV
jgi:hypothetical protein